MSNFEKKSDSAFLTQRCRVEIGSSLSTDLSQPKSCVTSLLKDTYNFGQVQTCNDNEAERIIGYTGLDVLFK